MLDPGDSFSTGITRVAICFLWAISTVTTTLMTPGYV